MNAEVKETEARGIVRATGEGWAEVEVEQGGCGRCHEPGGCGGQNLTQMMCSKPHVYRVDNPDGARVGEQVALLIEASVLGRSAGLAYVLPVLGLIVGALLGTRFGGDLGGMAGGGAGLVFSWLALRLYARRAFGVVPPRVRLKIFP